MLHNLKKTRQSGAAMIEFSLVLPILLALFVGVIYYGYVFVLDAAVTHAVKQGAQVAINIDPVAFDSPTDFETAVRAAVNTSVTNSLNWLPSSARANVTVPPATFTEPTAGESGQLLTITVVLVVAGNSSPLLPQITLPGIGAVPPLPPALNGVAQVVL